ncbi:hypothetical protein NLG97_g7348 [Lecanicillium saksenae]|uniref:Uncharacterized protein n=1 Tax=Lecanicillium saksenae TaxID=468837 RepID=A0ACC1QPM1_9HYPO|nr:hypothetical protein NLG97_g7348 [Lecanicillium saksenae]
MLSSASTYVMSIESWPSQLIPGAIRKFVLGGGWRKARYLYEPTVTQLSVIHQSAIEFKKLAAKDDVFAMFYGSSFQRVNPRVFPPDRDTAPNETFSEQ